MNAHAMACFGNLGAIPSCSPSFTIDAAKVRERNGVVLAALALGECFWTFIDCKRQHESAITIDATWPEVFGAKS